VAQGRDHAEITKVAHYRFGIDENGEKAGELIAERGRLAALGTDTTFDSLITP
jgi:hypothetical protein